MKKNKSTFSVLWIFLFIVVAIVGCTKEKVPKPVSIELTKWEKISGNYKVYDTLGGYLYDMSILHIHNEIDNTDSLFFENLDDLFYLTNYQSLGTNIPQTYVNIGYHDPIIDKNGKSWFLIQATDFNYNVLLNDTIKLKFRKSNINYYISDLVPYCDTTKIQIAVKQH